MSYYDILGIDRDASYEEISNTYRILAKKFYLENDKSPKAEAFFNDAYEAFLVLQDKEKRKIYDESFRPSDEFFSAMLERTKEDAACHSKNKFAKYSKRLIKRLNMAALVLPLLSFLFLAPLFFEYGNIEKKFHKDLGFLVLPDIPDINEYDAIFIGENHMSVQNFDIELALMKFYYSLGIRDFIFESGFAESLFEQYYFDSGDEECFNFLARFSGGRLSPRNSGRVEFYRKTREWNSALDEKIKVHGFDIDHDFRYAGMAALWFFVLRNYEEFEDMNDPLLTHQDFLDDYENSRERYSVISEDDLLLLERILKSMGQGEAYRNLQKGSGSRNDRGLRAVFRERSIIENFREILVKTGGRKVLAIMGYYHSSLDGYAKNLLSDMQFPSISTKQPCLANALKDEIRIASIVMRTVRNTKSWPYFIRIRGWKLARPYKSTYHWGWPYGLPAMRP